MLTHRTLRSALAAAVVLAALSGCASSGSSSPAGDWGVVKAGQPSLTVESNGSWHGNDGCNAMKGDGKISGQEFTFGPFASTLVACEGVTPWLNLAVTAKVDGDSLVVFRGDGSKIGTLSRR
ncbi:MAG: META domain-containing protein [Actinobacteria bacterium]|nr:META domain-containing protein [Actinomycetota bacterium]